MNYTFLIKYIAPALLAGLSFSAVAQAPDGYYSSLDGKSGNELMKAVKAIGKKNHKTISYGDDTWTAFRSTDVCIVNGQECWWDMYSNNRVPISSGHPGMNIEHSVANSWWDGTKNDAYKDIVHLNPSDAEANNRKGNYPLGIVANITYDNGVTFVGKPASGYGGGSNYVYEPADMYKGDFARVFMYIFTIYDDINWGTRFTWMYDTTSDLMFKPWAYNMLLEWNAADAVSDKEIARNNGIAATQGNRNPFIDLPDLPDYIWGAKRGEAYHVEGAHNPDPNPTDPDDPDNPDNPNNPAEDGGSYLLVESQQDIFDGGRYVIVADIDYPVALSTSLSSTFFTATRSVTITDDKITELPADAAMVTLEGSGSTYSLHMADRTGEDLGYIASTSAKKMTLAADASADGARPTLTVADGITTVDYGKAGTLQYNLSAPRFTTYTSEQRKLRFFRYVEPEESGVRDADIADDSPLVEIWGNNIIAPEGARIFDLNGREVKGENLAPGIYIVTKPSFKNVVKAIIR